MTLFTKNKAILILIVLPFVATSIVLLVETNFLISTLLFFGLPVLFLSYINKYIIQKSLWFSLAFSIPIWVLFDILATVGGAWEITETVFPHRFLNIITYENLIFAILFGLFIILFYEHFFDKGKRYDKNSKRLKKPLLGFTVLALIVSALALINPSFLFIPYVYIVLWVLFVFPFLLYFLFTYRQFIVPFTLTTAYFFLVLLLFEFAAIKTHLWYFPGDHFIGFVTLFGVQMPFEEFFLWSIIATPSLIAFYELFSDDRKLAGN